MHPCLAYNGGISKIQRLNSDHLKILGVLGLRGRLQVSMWAVSEMLVPGMVEDTVSTACRLMSEA